MPPLPTLRKKFRRVMRSPRNARAIARSIWLRCSALIGLSFRQVGVTGHALGRAFDHDGGLGVPGPAYDLALGQGHLSAAGLEILGVHGQPMPIPRLDEVLGTHADVAGVQD